MTDQTQNQQEFAIQRIYIKDVSFEAPNTPEIFKNEWKPSANVDIHVNPKTLTDNTYEVVLKLTTTMQNDNQTAFLVEVAFAGIFTLKSFPADQLEYLLRTTCATILFPYVSEFIADLVRRSSFPPLFLPPVNFEAMYQDYMAKQKITGGEGTTTVQ